MPRVQYRAQMSSDDAAKAMKIYNAHVVAMHGKGFGKFLKHVGHAFVHSKIGRDIIKGGATALGTALGGPEGGALAEKLSSAALGHGGSGGGGSKPAPPHSSGGPPPVQQQQNTLSQSSDAAEQAGLGVMRRKRAAPKKKKAVAVVKRKRVHRKPF